MRILTLTWEFPPKITGGLSLACYGIVKALLKKGVEVDLILPIRENLYFPLRKEEDADLLPVASPKGEIIHEEFKRKTLRWIEEIPSAYKNRRLIMRELLGKERVFDDKILNDLLQILHDGWLFDDVREWTISAIEIARHLDFDIIHAHDWLAYPAGIVIKKISRKPLVAHIHATEFDRAGGPGERRIHDIEYLGLQEADRVVSVSNYTAREIAEKYLVDPSKIRVVHNAFIIEKVKEKKRLFKEPTVVFVGRITLQKGPDYFIEIAHRVLERTKNVRFIMAGRGDMERMVMERVASWGLGTKFLFSGFLSRNEVAELFASADIFVMSSVSEPFGIAALEAMSMGTVAIVAKNSGVAEITRSTFKVDFWDIEKMADIIVDLINNPQKLEEISKRSMEEASSLRWEDQVERLIAVYSELITS